MSSSLPLLFQGTLLSQQGNAIPNAKVQLWQTDFNGVYKHPNPEAGGSTLSDFQYFGTDTTDADGKFDFLTYRPGSYEGRPQAHFHFSVWADEDDTEELLVTQFYFKDDPLSLSEPDMLRLDVTEVDSNLYGYGSYVNGTIVINESSLSSAAFTTTDGDEESLLVLTPEQSLGPFYPVIDFFSMDNDLTAVDDDDDEDSIAKDTVIPTESEVTSFIPTSSPVLAGPVDEDSGTQGMGESTSPTIAEEEIVAAPTNGETVDSQEIGPVENNVAADEAVDLASSSSKRLCLMASTTIGLALLNIPFAS
jgi:hypothetical protein